jgi:hypothetical protein
MTCDVFILHANKDKSAARAVEKALSEAGFDCKAGDWDIKRPPKCRVVVLIFTRNAQDIVDVIGNVLWNKTPIVALLLESFNPTANLKFYIDQPSVQKMSAVGAPIEQPWPQLADALSRTVPRRVFPPRAEPQIVAATNPSSKPPEDEHPKNPPGREYARPEGDRLPPTPSRELIGFFSYSHRDNVRGTLSNLKRLIEEELDQVLGRNVVLWQDQSNIPGGARWHQEILKGINRAEFFIPVITPNAVHSEFCKYECEKFLLREHDLNGQARIFPLHYIDVSDLKHEDFWRDKPWLKAMEERQWFDWRNLRNRSVDDFVMNNVEKFCRSIKEALQSNSKTLKSAAQVNPSETAASD